MNKLKTETYKHQEELTELGYLDVLPMPDNVQELDDIKVEQPEMGEGGKLL